MGTNKKGQTTRVRDSRDGRFVPDGTEKRRPATTTKETFPKKGKK